MQSNQLPPLQQNSSPFSRPALTTPINNQSNLNKPLSDLPPLPPLSQTPSEISMPTNPNPVMNPIPTIIEKKTTNWLVIVAVAVIFLAIGMGIAYLIFINRSTIQSNSDDIIMPTVFPEQTVTVTPNTPTSSDLRYTSEDLKISFILPKGVQVEEVELPYNPEGCISQGVASYPKYNAIRVFYHDKELLFMGVDDFCNSDFITEETSGASVLYELSIENDTYKLLQLIEADEYGFMRMPITLGDNNQVAMDDTDAVYAVMRAQVGDTFTKEEFELAVLMVASILPL